MCLLTLTNNIGLSVSNTACTTLIRCVVIYSTHTVRQLITTEPNATLNLPSYITVVH